MPSHPALPARFAAAPPAVRRGRKLLLSLLNLGVASAALVLIIRVLSLTSTSDTGHGWMVALTVGACGVALACLLWSVRDTVELVAPRTLTIGPTGIDVRRTRTGDERPDPLVTWAMVREAVVADKYASASTRRPTLVVRLDVNPVHGRTLTGQRYDEELDGYRLCVLGDVAATPEAVRAAIAAHRPVAAP